MSVAPFYAVVFTKLNRIAARFGYAVALHGSMQRDFDIVLIPWTEDAEPEEKLLQAIQKFVSGPGKNYDIMKQATEKPHGRKAYVLYFDDGKYLDISTMPRCEK